jgi:hypothetical protein
MPDFLFLLILDEEDLGMALYELYHNHSGNVF